MRAAKAHTILYVRAISLEPLLLAHTQTRDIYLNAKVSQLLLKCYFVLFEPNILLHDNVINKSNDLPSKKNMNIRPLRLTIADLQQPKFEKSQSNNTLHFIESQCYTTLHFIWKRCLTIIGFQKQKGRQIKAGYFIHFFNVNYVNVKPSIFDEIGRLSTTKYQ